MTRRLFIFGGYDPDSILDDYVILYIQALSKIGDVILYMDNDMKKSELDKAKPFTIYAGAHKHGEYDFGSYKYGYNWAYDNDILKKYSHVYLVNDSMYLLDKDLSGFINNAEAENTDVIGIVFNAHKKKPHIQTWFFGMKSKVFLSDQFHRFITGVKKLGNKGAITYEYEQGFTRLLNTNHLTWSASYFVTRHAVYNSVKRLFKHGMPFLKKVSFGRRHGSLGSQVLYILKRIDPDVGAAIIKNANRVYGEKYVRWFLTANPFKIIYRNIAHSLHKIFNEGI